MGYFRGAGKTSQGVFQGSTCVLRWDLLIQVSDASKGA
jgi:hypothetical protein